MPDSKLLRGRNFLMTPGPSNIPDRVLAAMHRPAVDLVDSDFMAVTDSCFADLARVFRTGSRVFLYASNGHGAWEAALANLVGEGDLVLAPTTGMFSQAWASSRTTSARRSRSWPATGEAHSIRTASRETARGPDHRIKAVLAVHTDTATSVTSDIAAVRNVLDACRHPALLMADVVASLGTVDFRMDDWGVDVAVAGSQKGLMTPPGLAFTAVSPRALEVSRTSGIRRGYWDWQRRVDSEAFYMRFFGTPPEHLIWDCARRWTCCSRRAWRPPSRGTGGWRRRCTRGRRVGKGRCAGAHAVNPAERAASVTTIRVAGGSDANRLRILARDELDVSLGYGLGPLDGKAFRIGHMGWINEPMVLGALGGVEMALQACGVPYRKGGVTAAIDSLAAARYPEASRADAA